MEELNKIPNNSVSTNEINALMEDINVKKSKFSTMIVIEKEVKELKALQDKVEKKYARIKKLNEQIQL
ncbi:hypothetical protein HCN_1913 [Helicobacter cinaedi PAGU611]|uniref:hypothetical protein n=1 Tax=Helicobacter cinaedi TaxID=213 RepID=UPI00025D35AB|nr:hypothetical protein [Helicobacter cinaedi]BAM13069.1 hypothetical protein HCN_1913 [Helicobacter cinaedi PAGU611]BBB20975.1 hypothetical protein HC081234_21520 [Helicobacter cinaedi]BDB64084.1 hypothetical protein T36_0531 [Helicobacter cinaedi]BDB66086.1 hypothetical protein Hc94105_0271 [Helicobacter cinaedi]